MYGHGVPDDGSTFPPIYEFREVIKFLKYWKPLFYRVICCYLKFVYNHNKDDLPKKFFHLEH